MGNWRRIETDPADITAKGDDTLELSKDAAKAKPKKKPENKVSVHFCPHAAGESASEWYNCKDDPLALYEEF